MAVVVQGEGIVAIVDVDIHQGEVDAVALAGQPAQLAAQGGFILAVGVVAPEVIVADKTVALVAIDGDAVQQPVGHQRPRAHQPGAPAVVFTAAGLDAHGGFGGGFSRADIDQSRQRVGAVQGTLGPAQDLHLFDIKQGAGAPQAAEVDAIYEQANGGIERLLELAALPHATYLVEAGPGRASGAVDVGGQVEDALEVLGLPLADVLGCYHADAGGLVQQRGGPQLRGDNDLLQAGLFRCHGHGQAQQDGRQGGGVFHARDLTTGDRRCRLLLRGGVIRIARPLPTPVLTGSGSKGLPLRYLRPCCRGCCGKLATPRFASPV